MGGPSAATTSAVVVGGFLCIGLFLVAIAATIVLSLIAIYTPDHSVEGYGSELRFNSIMLKFLFPNGSYSFSGGTIGNSTELNNLCVTQYGKRGVSNVVGCILQNGGIWNGNSSTNSKRRRRATEVGGYAIYESIVFFSTTCPGTADIGKSANSTGVSSCVSQLLAKCNALTAAVAANFYDWTPTPSFTLEFEETNSTFVPVTINSVYSVPQFIAGEIAQSLGLDATTRSELATGCIYYGPISMPAINAIVASESDSIETGSSTQPSG